MLPALENASILGIPLRRLFVIAAVVIAAFNLGLRGRMVFQYRSDLGGVEHNVVHGIQKVMQGDVLYDDPEAPPFDVIQYTPAHFLVCATIAKVFGFDAGDVRAIYLINRLVALLCNVLLAWLVFRLARVGGAASWSSILAACFAFATLWEQSYGRMDALASAALFGAFLAFAKWLMDPRDRHLIICGVLGVLSLMTKQSGVIALIIPVLHVLLHRQWRPFRILAVSIVVGLLVALFGLSFMGSWAHIQQHIVRGLANGYSLMMWHDLFSPATYKYFIGWHVLAIGVVLVGMRSAHKALRFLALAVAISTVFAMVTGLKLGSRLNYLHDGLTLTFIGTSLLIARSGSPTRKNLLAWAFGLYGCLFAAFRTNSAMSWYHLGEPDELAQAEMEKDLVVRDVLINELHLLPNESLYITYRGYLEHDFVGQCVLTQKDIVQFSTRPLFDYGRFHDAMTDGTVRYVVTDKPSQPVSILGHTYPGWVPIRSVEGRTILGRDTTP